MITLVENHHQALKIWRQKKVKDLDLVHIDAHLDFAFHFAKPLREAIDEARSIKDLKEALERSLAFSRYRRDFEKQTNIGNYIYPAMREGIVKNFYWVIPGGLKEFKESRRQLRALIKGLTKQDRRRSSYNPQSPGRKFGEGLITMSLLGREFVICTLDKLPVLRQRLLLDIDTDFLVVDSLKNASPTTMIGKRKPWIQPEEFVDILRKKIKNPALTTIAYSVNGGFTPMEYRYLGDGVAYRLAPQHFDGRFKQNLKAAEYFNLFNSTTKEKYYKKATALNSIYRAEYNNYGPLYLRVERLSKAEEEFTKIARADHKNPHPYIGLGNVFLQRRDYRRAKRYFGCALNQKKNLAQGIFGLAQAEFRLKNLKKAKRLLLKHQRLKSPQAYTCYLLGKIYEKKRDFKKAAKKYQDAVRLGLNDINIIIRLLRISRHIETKDDIIKYVIVRYKDFKKRFRAAKRASPKNKGNLKRMLEIEKKMNKVEASMAR